MSNYNTIVVSIKVNNDVEKLWTESELRRKHNCKFEEFVNIYNREYVDENLCGFNDMPNAKFEGTLKYIDNKNLTFVVFSDYMDVDEKFISDIKRFVINEIKIMLPKARIKSELHFENC